MDFKAIWPLLRKDKWAYKPPRGLDIQYVYVAYYLNDLLRNVSTDKELCARLNISNVFVRPQVALSDANADREATPTTNVDIVGILAERNADTERVRPVNFTTLVDEIDAAAISEEDSAYEPEAAEDHEECSSDGDKVVTELSAPSVRILQPDKEGGRNLTPIAFGTAPAMDPNLVVEDDEAFLESDGEGGEDSVEVDTDENADEDPDDCDDDEATYDGSIEEEMARMAALMNQEESEALHLRVK
ncbi:hypothetical protein BBJ28_00024761, partial [Nothophytophthora sp. Chile5]